MPSLSPQFKAQCNQASLNLLGWGSDAALWFILILLGTGGVLALNWQELPFIPKKGTRVSLHVQDAYSLTKGSPVNFMGVRVGSVKHVYVSKEEAAVHVDLNLDQWLKQIPTQAEANIVANGLGGAKRLEFTLPEQPVVQEGTPTLLKRPSEIRVTEPYRQKTLWAHQIQVANSLRHGADSLGNVLAPIEVRNHQEDLRLILQKLQETEIHLADHERQMPLHAARFHRYTEGILTAFTLLEERLARLQVASEHWQGEQAAFRDNMQQAHALINQQRLMLQRLNERLNHASSGSPSVPSLSSNPSP
jgi:ABC-type transporter Mla subunit MlaD